MLAAIDGLLHQYKLALTYTHPGIEYTLMAQSFSIGSLGIANRIWLMCVSVCAFRGSGTLIKSL